MQGRSTAQQEGSSAQSSEESTSARTLLSRAIHLVGTTAVLVSLFYIFREIYSTRLWEIESQLLWHISWQVAIFSIIYGVCSLVLSGAWWRIMVWCNEPAATANVCHAIFGRAQIAKYIPGNIFSYFARHYMGQRAGFSHRSLAWAALLEAVGLIFAGCSLTALGLGYFAELGALVSVTGLISGLLLVFFFPIFFTRVLARHKSIANFAIPHKTNSDLLLGLMPIYALYAIFFVALGVVLWGIVQAVTDNTGNLGLVICIAIMAVTWVVGYVTPGASAGIGVRDALLILCLSQYISSSDSTLIAVAVRLTTVIGDVVFYGIAHLFRLPIELEASSCDASV